jgi:3-deoxy-D-manno-octulosonate 8-phosphate phosphatase (KDO 8-P phosphatase)
LKIFIDIDGTLTDGKMYIDHTGEKMFKAFHSRDVRAIRELIANGHEVTLVSADSHHSGIHFADKVGAEFKCVRDKSSLPPADVAIGDDAWDVSMLKAAKRAFCPNDADPSVRSLFCVEVLKTNGGQGVIAELIRHILNPSRNGHSIPARQGQSV